MFDEEEDPKPALLHREKLDPHFLRAFVLSLGAHLALIAVILLATFIGHRRITPILGYSVGLVNAPPGSPLLEVGPLAGGGAPQPPPPSGAQVAAVPSRQAEEQAAEEAAAKAAEEAAAKKAAAEEAAKQKAAAETAAKKAAAAEAAKKAAAEEAAKKAAAEEAAKKEAAEEAAKQKAAEEAAKKKAAEEAAKKKAAEEAAKQKAAAEAAAKKAADEEAARQKLAAATAPGAGGAGEGGGGGGGGGGEGEVRGLEFVRYYERMLDSIRTNWVWVGKQDDSLAVTLRFSIQPDGRITGVRRVSSSGNVLFDQSVENAVKSVRELGAPPEKYRRDFADVELVFRAKDLAQ